MLIAGNKLTPKQRQLVLSAFVHRNTFEHKASWAEFCVNERLKQKFDDYETH